MHLPQRMHSVWFGDFLMSTSILQAFAHLPHEINLLEGYGSDNPAAKSQGIKQLMAGGGVVLIGLQLIPLLSGLFS